MPITKSSPQYALTMQRQRTIYCIVYLLNKNFQREAQIEGQVVDGATFSVDSTSDIRRTCNISIIPTDSSFDIRKNQKIWLDKYLQIYVGIKGIGNNTTAYTNMGLYLINNPSQTYDATNNTININGIDLMATLTGMRNGNLEGIEYQVKAGSYIKATMQSLLQDAGISKENYLIEPFSPTNTVPNDISIGVGGTYYDLICQLRDINVNYETYFDQLGVFVCKPVPSSRNESLRVTDEIWKKVMLSYSVDYPFDEIKNSIEVIGKTLDDGTTPYAKVVEDDPNSPFYINGTTGEIKLVLSGGEYDNIQSNELALQRAKWELYTRCKMKDTVTITCLPIYWLDVNWVVELTLPNKQGVEETRRYLVQKINTTLGANGTQTITLMRYYPYYDFR